jgi:general secretion pathway protein K
MTKQNDLGYASVAAVAALAVLGAIAYLLSTSDRAALAAYEAQTRRGQMESAAQAGLDMAVRGLSASDSAQRWPIDGSSQRLEFQSMELRIRVQDEHGKVSLADLTEPSAARLFKGVGLSEGPATDLAQSLLDWIDPDQTPRPQGGEAEAYASMGIKPRDAPPRTLNELIRVRGMDRQTLLKIEPLVTARYDASGNFDRSTASPIALAAMDAAGDQSALAIQDRITRSLGRSNIESGPGAKLIGRRLTIDVAVFGPANAAFERACLVELTGRTDQPYVIRSCEEIVS